MALPEINLPADLPVDWKNGDIITPDGTSVGLTPQHGYNALNQYVNDAQSAINALRDYLSGGIDAETAKKLAVGRTIQTNLSSNSAASFDGSSNITPGVTGVLPVSKGGTGSITTDGALQNMGAAPAYTYGTEDLTAGESELATGRLYFVYE